MVSWVEVRPKVADLKSSSGVVKLGCLALYFWKIFVQWMYIHVCIHIPEMGVMSHILQGKEKWCLNNSKQVVNNWFPPRQNTYLCISILSLFWTETSS